MSKPILVGAVVYDPKVVRIWEIIARFITERGCPMDTVFFSNYELQTEALVGGRIHIAWQSPLAWLDTQRLAGAAARAVAMRDTDRDRVSHLIVPARSPLRSLAGLRGLRLGLGAWDSPQATLIPLGLLRAAGLDPGTDLECRRFDKAVGLHGDHVGGERDALEALLASEVEASALLDLNLEGWTADGSLDAGSVRILATTPPFDHCVFALLEGGLEAGREEAWLKALFSMDYEDPEHREMMDMEGLKTWLPGRTTGFGPLGAALEAERFFARRAAGEWN
jgi:phosphonate transport system substrate-binding protein